MRGLSLWRAEIKLTLPRFPFIILSLLAIVIALAVSAPASLINGMRARDFSLTLVSEANSDLMKMISWMVADFDLVRTIRITDDLTEASLSLDNGETDILIRIPDDVEETLYYGESIIVTVKANDAFLGSVAYRLANATTITVNELAKMTNYVYEQVLQAGSLSDENAEKLNAFLNQALGGAIVRYAYLDIQETAKHYDVQTISLLQFITVAVAAVFSAVAASVQMADGYLRRLAVHGFKTWKWFAIKILNSMIVALLISALALAVMYTLKKECDPIKYLLSTILLAAIVSTVCFAVLSINADRKTGAARTLLCCMAVLLLLLFAGGGFYPTFLMKYSIRQFNPVWLAHLLADWNYSNIFPSAGVFFCHLAPFFICAAIGARRWRRAI